MSERGAKRPVSSARPTGASGVLASEASEGSAELRSTGDCEGRPVGGPRECERRPAGAVSRRGAASKATRDPGGRLLGGITSAGERRVRSGAVPVDPMGEGLEGGTGWRAIMAPGAPGDPVRHVQGSNRPTAPEKRPLRLDQASTFSRNVSRTFSTFGRAFIRQYASVGFFSK